MSSLENPRPDRGGDQHGHGGHGHGGAGWLMIACCIPMLAIALVIALSGAGLQFLLVAVMCTVMMAAMMGAMTGGGDGEDRR